MSFTELIIIAIVAIIVLGPEKLPSTLVEIAKIIKAVKKQLSDAKESIETEIKLSEIKEETQKYKNDIINTSDNVRKKMSFEEFDKIKEELKSNTEEINNTINQIQNKTIQNDTPRKTKDNV